MYKVIYMKGAMSQETEGSIHVAKKDFKTKAAAEAYIRKLPGSSAHDAFIEPKSKIDKIKNHADLWGLL